MVGIKLRHTEEKVWFIIEEARDLAKTILEYAEQAEKERYHGL